MRSIQRDEDRVAICKRICALTASSVPAWGRMDANAMLAHLRLSARMALGALPVASARVRAVQVFPLKHLLLYVVPFPKGARTAPELLSPDGASLEELRSELVRLLGQIGDGPWEGPGPQHPLFGALSRREWGVVTHKHVDHHLRQFGV